MHDPVMQPTAIDIYERAARIYCAKAGFDPDESRELPHDKIAGLTTTVYRWQVVAEELIDFSMKLTALREAANADIN